MPYELAAWAVVPLLAALFSRSVSRFAPFTAQLFLVLQVGGLAITWGGPDADRRIVWAEPPPELFQFSSERNVIHVVLDEFQTDVFVAMLEEDGGSLGRTFTGFTFFADHLGAFPSTSLSLPAMLTGKEFRNEQPVPEFVRQAFSEGSIFASLNRAGYAIDATSIIPTPWFEAWFGPSGSPVDVSGVRFPIRKPFVSRDDYREFSARQLLELSVSRHVPHLAKRALSETRVLMDGGVPRRLAVRLVAGAAIVCGAPSAVSLAVFENQDWVWGLALMISGLFIAVAATRYGQTRFRTELINVDPRHVQAGRVYEWVLKYLVPAEFVVMFGWWMYQAVAVLDPDGWWHPIRMYSVGTCLLQWGVALVLLRSFNARLASASTGGTYLSLGYGLRYLGCAR